MKGQLELTRPQPVVQVRSLTFRQHEAWSWARHYGYPFHVSEFEKALCYTDPYGALRRLRDRGLVTQIGRGYYRGVTPREKQR